jgi:hypothetical protein
MWVVIWRQLNYPILQLLCFGIYKWVLGFSCCIRNSQQLSWKWHEISIFICDSRDWRWLGQVLCCRSQKCAIKMSVGLHSTWRLTQEHYFQPHLGFGINHFLKDEDIVQGPDFLLVMTGGCPQIFLCRQSPWTAFSWPMGRVSLQCARISLDFTWSCKSHFCTFLILFVRAIISGPFHTLEQSIYLRVWIVKVHIRGVENSEVVVFCFSKIPIRLIL